MGITKSEISTRTWHSPMSAASQGAFVVIPGIPRSDISYRIIKKRIRFLVGILYSLFCVFAFAAGAARTVSKLWFLYLWKIFVFFREL